MIGKMRYIMLAVVLATTVVLEAATIDEARKLCKQGDYSEALPMLQSLVKSSPSNGTVNYWLGVCLYETGSASESIKYLQTAYKKRVTQASQYLALAYYAEYDFEKASEAISQYESDLKRNKKELPEDMKALRKKAAIAQGMLDHVEKIVVIDSLSVPKDDFFKHYNLAASAGSLRAASALPGGVDADGVEVVHVSEAGDHMLWAVPDTAAAGRMYEAVCLYDGTWEAEQMPGEVLNDGGTPAYPFLMQDGLTIYYSIDGESSIGGYDLYMSRKDIDDGLYLGPQNLGMPYNSPFNDYMLAIDEENNVGWWATERNWLQDSVTIYVFIPNQTRENLSADDENIKSYAKISDYRATWNGGSYTKEAMQARSSKKNIPAEQHDFEFIVNNETVYTTLGDFKTREGRSLMEKLLGQQRAQAERESKLAGLREKYASSTASQKSAMSGQILQLEEDVEKARGEIAWTANSIRKIELAQAK